VISSDANAELAADGIGQLARHHLDRDRNRMASAQAAHDDVERVGKLRAEFFVPAAAHEAQRDDWQKDEGNRRHHHGFHHVLTVPPRRDVACAARSFNMTRSHPSCPPAA
jgi:hypothetical protein